MDRRHFLMGCPMLVAACATPGPRGRSDLLDFLKDGRSSRDALYLRLGPPVREFEQGRIVSWHLARDDFGYFVVSFSARDWYGVRFELVVVFGPDNIVQRHSMVEVRAP
jgi:hypothetical protein